MVDCLLADYCECRGGTAVLDTPRADTNGLTRICGTTLHKLGRGAPEAFQAVDSAIVALAQMQADGWLYVGD